MTKSTVISEFLALVCIAFLSLDPNNHVAQKATAQYNESYCQGKGDEMVSRGEDWMRDWSIAVSDPNGQIRKDGKQLVSEIGLTLVNCDASLDDHNKLTLMQLKDVIDAQIDNNIDYGPPCDPYCQSGPPIS